MLGARSSPTRLSQVPCEKVVRGGAVWEGQGSRVVCQKTAPFSLQLWSTTFLDGKARLYVIYLIEVSWFWLHCSENKDVGVKEMKAKFHCISLIFHFISTCCFFQTDGLCLVQISHFIAFDINIFLLHTSLSFWCVL